MSTIKILIVEDNPLYIIDLKLLVEELGYDLLGSVDNSEEVFSIIKKSKPDIILMDINIKGNINGIELAQELKNENIAIIFITGYHNEETFKNAKKVIPFGYLVKPFNKFTLESIIEYAVSSLSRIDNSSLKNQEEFLGWEEDIILKDYVFIKKKNQLEKVTINEIEYIQSEGNYSIISVGKRKFALKLSLVKVAEFLKKHPFLRINKRHLINMALVNSIDLSGNKISIGENQFSIGRSYKEAVLKRLKKLT